MLLLRNTQRVLDSKEYKQSSAPATSLVDRSRWANNGTFSNVTWVQLPTGVWVMNFNGTNSYVEIPDSPTMRMTQGGTIKCWIYARSAGEGGEGRIIDKSTGDTGQNGYYVALTSSNRVYIYTNGTGNVIISTNNAIPFGVWKQVVVTFSYLGRIIYVNGVNVTAAGTETSLPPNVAGAVRIGNRATAVSKTFDGYISPLKAYSKVFAQADVTRSFTAERSLYGV